MTTMPNRKITILASIEEALWFLKCGRSGIEWKYPFLILNSMCVEKPKTQD